MDATCAIQASIHVFSLVRKYVSRILGTYHGNISIRQGSFLRLVIFHSLIGGAHCKVLPVLIRLKVLHPVALL